MGVHDRTHPGRLIASRRDTESTTSDKSRHFCVTPIEEDGATERIDHVLPAGIDGNSGTEGYCSPSCFVRQMERVGSIQ